MKAVWRRQRQALRTVGLVGFGDVASRILAQRTRLQAAQPASPPLLAVSRRQGWDLDQKSSLQRLARRLRHWIILVPPGVLNPTDPRDPRTRGIARAIRITRRFRTRSPRIVYISTTGVYGDWQGAAVDEASPLRATLARSRRRIDAESVLRPLGAHILRAPGIISESALPVERIRRGTPCLHPAEDVLTNHVHADDLARACWAALWRGQPGRVTNVVMPERKPMGDYFDQVADAAGLPRPPRVSRAELLAAGARGELSEMALSFMAESRQVVSSRLGPELRLRLQHPDVSRLLDGLRRRRLS